MWLLFLIGTFLVPGMVAAFVGALVGAAIDNTIVRLGGLPGSDWAAGIGGVGFIVGGLFGVTAAGIF